MVLLSSSAFDDSQLLPFSLSSLDRSVDTIKVCIVVSASPLKSNGTNAIKTMDYLTKNHVANATFVDLNEGDLAKAVIRDSDLILLNGGNPFTLLSVLQNQSFLHELKSLCLSQKIVVGVSAGAMMFSPGLHLVDDFNQIMGFTDKGNNDNLTDLNCLNLFDEYFFPHFEQFSQKVPNLEHKLSDLELKRKVTIYKQSNGQTAVVRNRLIEGLTTND